MTQLLRLTLNLSLSLSLFNKHIFAEFNYAGKNLEINSNPHMGLSRSMYPV
ncbi:MAG: hypothetical protein ACI9O3_000366 [Colwellia sp.]|jgi:hypothetical protein